MIYPALSATAKSVNISDGEFSPLYDIIWSVKYEVLNWNVSDDYGICLFLRKSGSPVVGGGVGIDLGYSGYPGTTNPSTSRGVTGGILGIGLDTHGFFAAETTWPGGIDRDGLSSGLETNSITLRGSESDNYKYLNTHYKIEAFDLLSDGIKILRARLGNYGRTIYLDYRDEGDTDFVEILSQDVNLSIPDGARYTPGVSFAKPLTAQSSSLDIKVHSFHIEGKDSDPDETVQPVIPLEPDGSVIPYNGPDIVDKPESEIPVEPPVRNIVMCNSNLLPALEMSRSIDTNGPYNVGDDITFSVLITNTGNVTVDDIAFTDILAPLINITDDKYMFNGFGSLSAGEAATITYSYNLLEGDFPILVSSAALTTYVGVRETNTFSINLTR